MSQINDNFNINKQIKGKLPSLPFLEIKNTILGKNYKLSVACVSKKVSQEFNNQYREKNYPTNILSFPLEKDSGEILLQLNKIKEDAPNFDMTYSQFLKYLFIHGLLHLKGMQHGSTMEREEKKFLKKFS